MSVELRSNAIQYSAHISPLNGTSVSSSVYVYLQAVHWPFEPPSYRSTAAPTTSATFAVVFWRESDGAIIYGCSIACDALTTTTNAQMTLLISVRQTGPIDVWRRHTQIDLRFALERVQLRPS